MHICIQILIRSGIQGPNLLIRSTKEPVLPLKPLAYHMALGQIYNPCDLLSYRRLTQPWVRSVVALEGKTLTCVCPPPHWEELMNSEGVGASSDAGKEGILRITQSYSRF